MEVKIGNQVIQDIRDYDLFHMYSDLWMTAKQRKKLIRQGIDDSQNINRNRIGLRCWAILGEKAVASVYGNKFTIPLRYRNF